MGNGKTPGPLRESDNPAKPRETPGFHDEQGTWRGQNTPGPVGFRDHRRPTIRVADAGTHKAAPKLILINYEGGLSDKDLQTVVTEAKGALDATTRHAKDRDLKAKGVEVTSQTSLQGVIDLRKSGYILVYLIHDIKDEKRRTKVVRDILTAEGALTGARLDEIIKRVASDLNIQQNLHDPASDVAFINLDLTTGRGIDNLRVIAGNVIHEGIGHRAIPPPQGEATYHNPQGKGVMSKSFGETATKDGILFQPDEWDKVNAFLQSTVDNPRWNLTPAEQN
jgi:hypothetical protein